MLISLDSDDLTTNGINTLQEMYNEPICSIDDPLDLSDVDRITCIGHGNIHQYGNKTPRELAQSLINAGLKRDKPIVIDLLGCGVGDFTQNNRSYALNLSEQFFDNSYHNIRINAFETDSYKNDGINYHTYLLYLLGRFATVAVPQGQAVNLAPRNWMEYLDTAAAYILHLKVITSVRDVRLVFDSNVNHQITYERWQQKYSLNERQDEALTILNNRIGELKIEIAEANKSSFSLLYDVKLKTQKLKFLEQLREDVLTEQDPTSILRQALQNPLATERSRICIEAILKKFAEISTKEETRQVKGSGRNL